jgi:hypothetical protein
VGPWFPEPLLTDPYENPVRVCELDLLVVHTIAGRLTLMKPVRLEPGVRLSNSGRHRPRPESPFSPRRVLASRRA